jgi:hypothetical protein
MSVSRPISEYLREHTHVWAICKICIRNASSENSPHQCVVCEHASRMCPPVQIFKNKMYIPTRWGDQSWTKLNFSMFRLFCLIEAYGIPGKCWFLCVRLLAIHLFNEGTIFHNGSLLAAAE